MVFAFKLKLFNHMHWESIFQIHILYFGGIWKWVFRNKLSSIV